MGADGWITIYDADAIDAAGFADVFRQCFCNVYYRKIFGRSVYTVYDDTEGRDSSMYAPQDAPDFSQYEIDTWEVWT